MITITVHNSEAEHQLLVAVLAKLDVGLPRAEQLGCIAEWFHDALPRGVWASLHKLYAASEQSGVPLKLENLLVVAQQDGTLEMIKQLAAEAAFAQGLTVPPLAREVNGWYGKRKADAVVAAYQKWSANGASPASLMRELNALREGVDAIARKRAVETGLPSDIHKKKIAAAFSTGYALFDRILHGGYRNGNLILVGAPTKSGKPVLAANLAARAVETGREYGVLVFTLEVECPTFKCRLLATLSGIPFLTCLADAEGREIEPETKSRLDEWIGYLDGHLRLYHEINTIPEMAQRIAWARDEWGDDLPLLVVIDHLNLISHPALDRKGSGLAFEEICYDLKHLATREGLEVPIVLNGQLDDATARKMNAKGRISIEDFKMRGSRAPEQAADAVIAFCRHPKRQDCAAFQCVLDRFMGQMNEGVLLYDLPANRFCEDPLNH